jgi:hypothetical protein
MHICSHDTCATSLNESGHSICNITGLCTKMLSFSNLEFVNTVCAPNDPTPSRCKKTLRLSRKKRFKYIAMNRPQLTDKKMKELIDIDDIVNTFVREMLCSEQWEHSNHVEHERYASKWSAASTKVLREFKRTNPGILPIIPDMYSRTLSTMGNTRIPPDTTLEDRKILGSWCAENIRHHLMMLHTNFPDVIQHSRLRGVVVGLMYLMRCGIVVKGIVVLQRLHILHNTLPLETHLSHMFAIKGKVITETENMVKQVLKSLSPSELVVYGTPQNTNPLSGFL